MTGFIEKWSGKALRAIAAVAFLYGLFFVFWGTVSLLPKMVIMGFVAMAPFLAMEYRRGVRASDIAAKIR